MARHANVDALEGLLYLLPDDARTRLVQWIEQISAESQRPAAEALMRMHPQKLNGVRLPKMLTDVIFSDPRLQALLHAVLGRDQVLLRPIQSGESAWSEMFRIGVSRVVASHVAEVLWQPDKTPRDLILLHSPLTVEALNSAIQLLLVLRERRESVPASRIVVSRVSQRDARSLPAEWRALLQHLLGRLASAPFMEMPEVGSVRLVEADLLGATGPQGSHNYE